VHTDRCGNTRRQKYYAKGSGKKLKYKSLDRDTTNIELEMYEYTSNNWGHWNSKDKIKEKSGSYIKKKVDRFSTKDSYTWNNTQNTESAAA
jgi:hypothetical protein